MVSFSVVASYMALYDWELCFVRLAEMLGNGKWEVHESACNGSVAG
jgi:hypothetical protein